MSVILSLGRRAVFSASANGSLRYKYATRTRVRCFGVSRYLSNIVTSPFPDVEQPKGNLVNTIFENAHQWGSKTALKCSETGESYTYNQVVEYIKKIAGFLSTLGLVKGDVIALYLHNCPEFPIVLYGALSIGIRVTTIDPNYKREELSSQMEISGATLLVAESSFQRFLKESGNTIKDNLHIITNGPAKDPTILNLHDILNDTHTPNRQPVDLCEKDIALMPFSSGTTGIPKCVNLSHGALSINLKMMSHPELWPDSTTDDQYQESYLSMRPFCYMYGMLLLMLGLQRGVKLITFTSYKLSNIISHSKRNDIETLHFVPYMLNVMIESPLITRESFPSLKSIVLSGTPLLPSTAEAIKNKLERPIFIQEAFGMTEILFSLVTPLNQECIGKCGKLLPNVTSKIVDLDTGASLGRNSPGEICFRTPSLMSGYYKNEAATSASIDSEGWFHSGDIGYFDDEGYLKVIDRNKDFIRVEDVQVSPSELEDILLQHPDVIDAGVIGVPHETLGEVPKAFLVTARDINADDVHRYIESRSASQKWLRVGIHFVKELPRSASGKLLRKQLKNYHPR